MAALSFQEKYGPWALITGAGNGLGAEFGRQIAARGLDIVLVDVDEAGLEQTAAQIRQSSARQVKTVTLDLTRADFLDPILDATQGLDIGLLVNNAGITTIGHFTHMPLADHLRVIDLNVRVPMSLAHVFAPRFAQRGRGGILFVGSLSGAQGTAYVANYAATKAHNQILAEGLWQELREQGVDVTACLLGTTRTPGFIASKPQLERAGPIPIMEMGSAVTEALDSLGRGPRAVAGRLNRVLDFVLQRLLPRKTLIRLVSRATTALYGP